jgi:hypothetical protein
VAVVGLVAGTLLADGAAFAAIAKMTATHGRSMALALLAVACVLSLTTFLMLRGAGGDDGDGGGGREPPEPPWWPEFERRFRDYERRSRRPAGGGRRPAGVR